MRLTLIGSTSPSLTNTDLPPAFTPVTTRRTPMTSPSARAVANPSNVGVAAAACRENDHLGQVVAVMGGHRVDDLARVRFCGLDQQQQLVRPLDLALPAIGAAD